MSSNLKNQDMLHLKWSKKEKDFLVHYPKKCDGNLILSHLLSDVLVWGGVKGKDSGWTNFEVFNLRKELEKRGYDLQTLKFKIKLKK